MKISQNIEGVTLKHKTSPKCMLHTVLLECDGTAKTNANFKEMSTFHNILNRLSSTLKKNRKYAESVTL